MGFDIFVFGINPDIIFFLDRDAKFKGIDGIKAEPVDKQGFFAVDILDTYVFEIKRLDNEGFKFQFPAKSCVSLSR